jgi:hypothetical protein
MTARLTTLTSIAPPWLLRTAIDRSVLERELDRLKVDSGFATCFLDGGKMKTLNGVFNEFATGLEFPDYFGFNSAAFDECLNDLSWLNANGICVVILVAGQLLIDESGEIGWMLQLLEDACREWSLAVEEGEAWDRSPIPFHVLFHAANGSAERMPLQLAALPSLEQL